MAVDHPLSVPLSRSPLPARFGIPTHLEALQKPPVMQEVSSVQVVPHAPAEHLNPLQLVGVFATQVPPPLQMWSAITDDPVLSHAGVELQTVAAG